MTAPARPRILPAAVATSAAFSILIALGIWQLQRRTWKAGILAAIDRAEHGPAVPLHGTPAPFAKISVAGMLLPQAALYGVEVREDAAGQPREGTQVIGILRRPAGKPVIVDLGWRPISQGAPDARGGVAAGPAEISGYARAADTPGWLSATDDIAGRHFYTLNPARIGNALGVPDVEPFTLVALGRAGSPEAPVPATSLPRPPNNHLQYAFTWFGLAASLVAVFVSWALRNKA